MTTTNAMDGAIASVAEGGTGLATLTANNVILGNGTSAVAFVAPSTSGNVLTSNGTIWQSTAPAGSSQLVLIATATASSSSALTFTSKISSAYSEYWLIFNDLVNSGATASVNLAFSTNNGSTYVGTASSQKQLNTVGASTAISYTNVANNTPILLTSTQAATSTWNGHMFFKCSAAGIFWGESCLQSGASGSVYKTYIQGDDLGVNAFEILPSSSTFASGTVILYGVKNT